MTRSTTRPTGALRRAGRRARKLVTLSVTSTLVATTFGISTANALLPSPREGECDPDIFGAFPDKNIGPGSLKTLPILEDPNLGNYVKDTDAAVVLGKALFWDMQVGSDGVQACASCHFRAGADARSKNQLAPGGNGVVDGGVNAQLTADMFPLTKFADPTDRTSTRLRTTDDVVSSQGVHSRTFKEVDRGDKKDEGVYRFDEVFNVGGVNTRRVEPRNTPTMINAVFNLKNFWDGRASNIFNGRTPFGARDENARVLKAVDENTVEPVTVRLDFSSLASQAVGPIVSEFEMAFFDRPLHDIGKRLVSATPLKQQRVHPEDSVLGPYVAHSGKGLTIGYDDLIRQAFQPEWWDSDVIVRVDPDGIVSFSSGSESGGDDDHGHGVDHGHGDDHGHHGNDDLDDNEYTLMEYNFSLFFGLAVQEYEKTLVSDDAKIDRHFDSLAAGGPGVLNEQELRGMDVFTTAPCSACHSGPEFSNASFRIAVTGFFKPDIGQFIPAEQVERMFNGECQVVVYEQGYYNIGVRPTEEDLGAGGRDPFGNPLNAAELLTLDPSQIPSQEILTERITQTDPPIQVGEATALRGSFKIPDLRNVELTAPYFHNGGQRTLREVIEFYDRGGDFREQNVDNIDFEIGKLGLTEQEKEDLVAFLLTLTDERVRNQMAPFDHPEIRVPNGHPGDSQYVEVDDDDDDLRAEDSFLVVPAVGANGGPLAPAFLE
jgi:cytochrome c peroxidase